MQCCLFYCIMENEQRGMITFILAVCGNVDYVYTFPLSPPSRAAWIEILLHRLPPFTCLGRRLHGRRGLKYKVIDELSTYTVVAAFTGGVD